MPGWVGAWLKRSLNTIRLAKFFDAQSDPWERLSIDVPVRSFGEASQCEFATYLEGPTTVTPESLAELCDWLRGCEGVDDLTLFRCNDHWQHPSSFEKLRRGDCEDHALWAWRHLVRLGVPACFMVGLWQRTIAHAWVCLTQDGTDYVLETTAKSQPMLHPVADVREAYCPGLAVDARCRTYVYQGYLRLAQVMRAQK